jgi:hypothetical protein
MVDIKKSNKMKLGKVIILITLFSLLVPYLSFAQIPPPESFPPPEIPTSFFGCLPTDPLRVCILRILDKVLKVILVLALAFAAVFIAWSGILYILRGGEGSEKQQAVRTRILYAAVGLVVAFLAWVLTVIIARTIGGGSPEI